MALQKNAGHAIYLTVADGKLVRSHKEAQQGVTSERISKTGKLVHEEKFDSITGHLISLKTKENDYGKQYQLTVMDGEEACIISIPYSSRYSTSFLKALPNINLDEPVKLMPWSMVDKQDATKKITGVTCWQNGVKILPFYTKENPNGLPKMVQVKVKGKMVWDSSDLDAFLEEMANEKFSASAAIAADKSEDAPF